MTEHILQPGDIITADSPRFDVSNAPMAFDYYIIEPDGSRRIMVGGSVTTGSISIWESQLRPGIIGRAGGYGIPYLWSQNRRVPASTNVGEYLPYAGANGETPSPSRMPVNQVPFVEHYQGYLARIAYEFLTNFGQNDYDVIHSAFRVQHTHVPSDTAIARNKTFQEWFRRRMARSFLLIEQWATIDGQDDDWRRQFEAMRAEYRMWCSMCEGRGWIHDVLVNHPTDEWLPLVNLNAIFDIDPVTYAPGMRHTGDGHLTTEEWLPIWQRTLAHYRSAKRLEHPNDVDEFDAPTWVRDDDTVLSSITIVNQFNFSQFVPIRLAADTYEYSVTTTLPRIRVSATTRSRYSTVLISHLGQEAESLPAAIEGEGDFVFTITVTAEDGSTQDYVVTISRS